MGRRRRKGKRKPQAVIAEPVTEISAPGSAPVAAPVASAPVTATLPQDMIQTYSMGLSQYTPPPSAPWNWWQYGNTARLSRDGDRFGPVQTCINIISQDISRLPLHHERVKPDRSRELVLNKAPSRVFRNPNTYQTKSDFLLYMLRSLLMDGNAYVLARRNSRGAENAGEVDSLWPLPPWSVHPYVVPETGDVIYQVGHSESLDLAQPDVDEGYWVPARDMLHVRLQTPRSPVLGESPILAAYYPAITGMQINQHSANFFTNMARPGGILRHPGKISEEGIKRIKERWNEIAANESTGDTAVLPEGMEWQQLQMTAVDAEVAAIYQLSERQIFQLFRIPPFLGGDLEKATFSNVESLIRFYLQSCLGFYVDHMEESFTKFFRLPPDEQISFDLDQALLAGDFKERMDALGRGVQNGIFAPNEARARENLPPVEFGDEPRVQQQLVPLAFGVTQVAEEAQSAGAPSPAEPPPAEPSAPEPEEDEGGNGAGDAEDNERGLFLIYSEELRKPA